MVEIKDKINLSIEEASELFGIGRHKIRELSKMPKNKFTLAVGSSVKIKRKAFEEYLETVDKV